jgi:hypothetical protein
MSHWLFQLVFLSQISVEVLSIGDRPNRNLDRNQNTEISVSVQSENSAETDTKTVIWTETEIPKFQFWFSL